MNTTKQDQEIKVLVDVLFREFRSLTILPKPTSEITRRSEMSLKRDRYLGVGMPYTKLGSKKGSDKVQYNIYDVAKFVVLRKSKVMP